MLLPFRLLVLAEVAVEGLLAPGTVDRVRDGGEGRDGFVFSGVTEELSSCQPLFTIQLFNPIHCLFPGGTERNGMGRRTYNSKSTMPTHTMTGNTHPPRIQLGKRRKDSLGQFLGDVRVHVIAIVVGGLCRVNVEARAGAEVVRVVFALDVEAACITSHYVVSHGLYRVGHASGGGGGHTRTGIRIQHGNALLARAVLEKALLGAVLSGAGQAREVDQDGHFLGS